MCAWGEPSMMQVSAIRSTPSTAKGRRCRLTIDNRVVELTGDTNAAIAAYERAIQLAPGQPDFQLSYGLALEAAKRPHDAAGAYRRYLELEPQAPDAEKVKAHLAELEPATTAPAAAGS